MKKDALSSLRSKMRIYEKDMAVIDLKTRFDYPDESTLLFDFLALISRDVNKFNVRTRSGSYKYMFLIIECFKKLIYIVDIREPHPLYYEIKNTIDLFDNELKQNHNKTMNEFLIKVKNGFNGIIETLDSYEYKNRYKIEAANKEKIRAKKDAAKQIVTHMLFEIKDIRLIINIKNEYFHEAIVEDIENIVKRLCYEYTYGANAFNEYYYLLFMYLSSDESFGLSKHYNYIEENIKESLKKMYNSGIKITDHNVNQIDELLRKITKTKDSKLKYDIQKPIDDNRIVIASSAYEVDAPFDENKIIIIPKKYDGVTDMRNRYTFTIDPTGADCLDDALSFRKLDNGNFEITVYIADVAGMITPGSEIDRYACTMAETIFRNKTIPMLPNKICNSYSSLIMGSDKLVHAYTFEITPNNKVTNTRIERALIRVKDNYSYDKIDSMINYGNTEFADGLRELYQYSKASYSYNVRRQGYRESKEILDPSRAGVERYGNNPSNRIISELKILTNYTLSKKANKMNIPFIYRNNLQNTKISDPNFVSLFNDSEFERIKYVLYAAFSSSYYSNINEGHYGLDLEVYAHTSIPLRNYSSFFNQRMIDTYMIDEKLDNVDTPALKILCGDISKYLNKRIILNKMYAIECSNKRKIKILTN